MTSEERLYEARLFYNSAEKILWPHITMPAWLVANFTLFFHSPDMILMEVTCDTIQILAALRLTICVSYQNGYLLVFK